MLTASQWEIEVPSQFWQPRKLWFQTNAIKIKRITIFQSNECHAAKKDENENSNSVTKISDAKYLCQGSSYDVSYIERCMQYFKGSRFVLNIIFAWSKRLI